MSELSSLWLFGLAIAKTTAMIGLAPAFLLAVAIEQRTLMDYFAKHSLDLLKRLSDRDESIRLLEAASHTLRSYQYGNAATGPAGDMASSIDQFLATGEPQTLAGKAKKP